MHNQYFLKDADRLIDKILNMHGGKASLLAYNNAVHVTWPLNTVKRVICIGTALLFVRTYNIMCIVAHKFQGSQLNLCLFITKTCPCNIQKQFGSKKETGKC